MAEFVYIQNSSKQGKIGISQRVFDQLVSKAILNVPGVSQSDKQMKKNQKIRLNRPVQCTIKRGIVHVWIAVDLKKGTNIQEVSNRINDEISRSLAEATEQVPFDIQIKVESFI